MMFGAWAAGICGDRFGRRFTYQFSLLIFGSASLVAAFAPNIETLIGLRFVMGLGLGAEVVVGYATLTEFVPAAHRGRMNGWLAVITNSSLFVSTILAAWIIPNLGWRYMFALVGVGALIIWALRKNLPESPRWLEAQGRHDEAASVVDQKQREGGLVVEAPDPARTTASKLADTVTVWSVFKPPVLGRTLMGILVNVVVGSCLYGFINWLPTFLVKQAVSIASSLVWVTVMAMGFCLFLGLYIILAIGFALHVPELFRTEDRLRGTAVCNTARRIATACVQYVVIWLFAIGGLAGVVSLLVSLLVVQAVVFAVFDIETARRPLEEIDDTPVGTMEPSSPPALGELAR